MTSVVGVSASSTPVDAPEADLVSETPVETWKKSFHGSLGLRPKSLGNMECSPNCSLRRRFLLLHVPELNPDFVQILRRRLSPAKAMVGHNQHPAVITGGSQKAVERGVGVLVDRQQKLLERSVVIPQIVSSHIGCFDHVHEGIPRLLLQERDCSTHS